jgi:hypothetical protein
VAVAPNIFSFFRREQTPGAEPRASGIDQASTAETTGHLELEVFDPHIVLFEPPLPEIARFEEHVAGLEAGTQKVTEPDPLLVQGQPIVAALGECALSAMTPPDGTLAGFGGQTDGIAAALADADRIAAVVSGVERRIASLEAREDSLAQAAERIAAGLADADRLATQVVSGVETRIGTLEEH